MGAVVVQRRGGPTAAPAALLLSLGCTPASHLDWDPCCRLHVIMTHLCPGNDLHDSGLAPASRPPSCQGHPHSRSRCHGPGLQNAPVIASSGQMPVTSPSLPGPSCVGTPRLATSIVRGDLWATLNLPSKKPFTHHFPSETPGPICTHCRLRRHSTADL